MIARRGLHIACPSGYANRGTEKKVTPICPDFRYRPALPSDRAVAGFIFVMADIWDRGL